MTLKFSTKEKRDELAERLATLAIHMQQSRDQGNDGRIWVTDEMMGDIRVAAAVVALSEIADRVPALAAQSGMPTKEK